MNKATWGYIFASAILATVSSPRRNITSEAEHFCDHQHSPGIGDSDSPFNLEGRTFDKHIARMLW